MSAYNTITKLRNDMRKIYKKITILNKKQQQMGLTQEEELTRLNLNSRLLLLHEEVIDTHISETMMPILMTKECNIALKEIQKLVPWKGNLILKDEDFDKLMNADAELTDIERETLGDKLRFLHEQVLIQFQKLSSTESGWLHIYEVSQIFNKDKDDGSIIDVLIYIDTRYRDLADMLDIELAEVEVSFEEDIEGDENFE